MQESGYSLHHRSLYNHFQLHKVIAFHISYDAGELALSLSRPCKILCAASSCGAKALSQITLWLVVRAARVAHPCCILAFWCCRRADTVLSDFSKINQGMLRSRKLL